MEENKQPLSQTLIPKHKLNKANVVMAILFVLALAAAITFGILWATKKTDAPVAESNTSSSTENQTNDTIEQAPSPEQQITEQPSVATLGFNVADIANYSTYPQYVINRPGLESVDGTVFSLSFNTEGIASVRVNWEAANRTYGINREVENKYENIEIQTSKKVVDMFTAMFGQSTGDETVLLLMEDGDVEYIPMMKAVKNGEIKSYGKIDGLENIAKFYLGSGYAPNTNTLGGGIMTFAQSTDGKIYQLYTILQDAGAWN